MRTPTTTAQARAWAYDANMAGDYAEAARLYAEALRLYPDNGGELAAADKMLLAKLAQSCRQWAETMGETA